MEKQNRKGVIGVYTKSQLVNEQEEIDEKLINGETILMGLGFIPVIGEVADTILIMKYLKEGRWIEAFIMLICLIPTVGDVVGKPFLIMGRRLGIFKNAEVFTKFVTQSPKGAKLFQQVGKHVNTPSINKWITQVSKKNPNIAAKAKQSQSFFASLSTKVEGVLKTGVGKTVRNTYKQKALAKYVAKKGIPPSNFLTKWFYITYLGRRSRKLAFKKAIIGSNLLGLLGLPNIESFQDFISNDENAEKVLNMPEFEQVYGQVTTPQDEVAIDQENTNKSEDGGFLKGLGTALMAGGAFKLSLPLLKKIAAVAIR